MKGPKVSVVMSVYNGAEHLREAVESILNQTFTDFEFIIVDDGSADSTWDILKSYEDPRIVLARNRENIGLTKSLNEGLGMMKGDYIARQDADDVSLPERLGEQVAVLDDEQGVGLVCSSFVEMNHEGQEVGTVILPAKDHEIMDYLLRWNCLCHGAVMFRRECVARIGVYRDEFQFAQDYDLWLRIAERYKVANLSRPLYKRRISPGIISIIHRQAQDEYARLAIELAEERARRGRDRLGASISQSHPNAWQRRRSSARITFFWARELSRQRRRREALTMLARSILNNPFRRDPWALSSGVVRRKFRQIARYGLRMFR